MPTQTMVAEHAGVSQEAVSHILGGKRADLFSEKTQEKVRKAAKLLGYQPNRAAQIMRRGRTNLVVHLNCGGYTELAGQRSYHIGRYVHEAGFDYQVVDSYWWPDEGEKIVNKVLSLHPEGVIISGAAQTIMDILPLRKMGVHVVGLGMEFPDVSSASIFHDVRASIAELTRHCLAQGRQPVAVFNKCRVPHWSQRGRRLGFLDAFAGGEKIPEIDIQQLPSSQKAAAPAILYNSFEGTQLNPFEPGTRIARQLLENNFLPDALICSNDHYVFSILSVLQKAGVSVPGDMFLSGFDNLSFSTHGTVPLTTVEQPIEQMCAAAMDILQKRINQSLAANKPRKLVFPCRIHWRESTASFPDEPLSQAFISKKQSLMEI